MVRTIEFYKKCTSTFASILMFLSMGFTLAILAYNFIHLNNKPFFLSRTRLTVTEVIDFEEITTNEVYYFLYRNETTGAIDAGAENNVFIVSDADEICEF